MKKMFFMAALAVAGLVSANTTEGIKRGSDAENVKGNTVLVESKIQNSTVQTLKVAFKPQYNWVTIVTPCGAVFYLDYNDYSNDDAFWEDAHHFAAIKCS